MLFNSIDFLIYYLPIVIAGFFSLTSLRLYPLARAWLLASSLFFYGYWDVRFLPLLVGSILFNYLCGKQILAQSSRKTLLLWIGISSNLALLFYFKYVNFFLSVMQGSTYSLSEIVLPLGISFFTFTQIAYLVDAYQGKAEECDILSYGLFVTIFPHLIAGPILHHKQMITQFKSTQLYTVSWPHIAQGTFLFVIGLSKKMLIADPLSSYVVPVFDWDLPVIPFIQAWVGALSYTLQLYFDFSGYSDMAVGLGLLFNLYLPINFNSPYQADSIIDFWRRWHITLSHFLKDYLYIPLGGNRAGEWAKMRNLFITMVLGGLWHGAGWTFVLWGACHGSFLIINHLWRRFNLHMPHWLARTVTLLAVIVGWVIFRAPDVPTAFNILSGMAGLHGIVLPEKYAQSLAFLNGFGVSFETLITSNFHLQSLVFLVVVFCGALWLPNSQIWMERFKQRPLLWSIPCLVLFFACVTQFDESIAQFLYYQF